VQTTVLFLKFPGDSDQEVIKLSEQIKQQGGFMLIQKFSKHLAAAAFALALVALPAITGSSIAAAQDGYNRNRDYNRDRGYDDRYYDDRNHQRRERDDQKRHERAEKEDIKQHQRQERYGYGNSDELRDHQRHEKEELKQHKREEKDDVQHHQRSERGGYNGDGRYSRTDGYYDEYGRSRSSRPRY
jgi:flagellar biosynthesis GTPase FlhF